MTTIKIKYIKQIKALTTIVHSREDNCIIVEILKKIDLIEMFQWMKMFTVLTTVRKMMSMVTPTTTTRKTIIIILSPTPEIKQIKAITTMKTSMTITTVKKQLVCTNKVVISIATSVTCLKTTAI